MQTPRRDRGERRRVILARSTMVLVNLVIHLDLPYAESKKGRRAVLNSVKARLKNKNISVLDISDEYPKHADIAVAFLAPDTPSAKQKIQAIEELLYSINEPMSFDMEYELL